MHRDYETCIRVSRCSFMLLYAFTFISTSYLLPRKLQLLLPTWAGRLVGSDGPSFLTPTDHREPPTPRKLS